MCNSKRVVLVGGGLNYFNVGGVLLAYILFHGVPYNFSFNLTTFPPILVSPIITPVINVPK